MGVRPANEFPAQRDIASEQVADNHQGSQWRPVSRWAPWALVAVHAAVVITGTLRHEIWRDEAQSWLIAKVSGSPLELLDWAPREGHPVLWYLCVWVISRFSDNVMAMQLFHAAIAVGSGMLIALAMPRPLWQRGLLMFGYFFVFEYALIARSYGLGVFLILAACALAARRQRPGVMLAIGVLLLLAANTSVHGALLAAALGTGLAVDWLLAGRSAYQGDVEAATVARPRAPAAATITAAGLCALGLLLCYLQISQYPAGERGFRDLKPAGVLAQAVETPTQAQTLISAGEPLVRGMLPLSSDWSMLFWEKNFVTHGLSLPAQQPILVLTLVVTLALLVAATLCRMAVAAIGWTGLAGLTLFHYLGLLGSMRHMGHYPVVFVMCLWLWDMLAAPQGSGRQSSSRSRRLASLVGTSALAAILLIHVAAGFMAVRHDIRLPFSTARLAAEAVEREFPPQTLVLIWNDVYCSALPVYLGREVYHVDSQRYGGPVDWTARAKRDREAHELETCRREMVARGVARAALVRHEPVPEKMRAAGLEVRLIGRAGTAIAQHESFWVYELRLASQLGQEVDGNPR